MTTEANITIEDLNLNGKLAKIVHIKGQLDESNVDEKIQEVYKLIEASPKGLSLIFDLENLEYMNSKSIGYLTDLYGKITESGGTVAISKPKPNITDILQVVGLTQLIKIFETTDEAGKFLAAQGAQPEAAPTIQPPSTTQTTSAPAAQPAPTPAQPTAAASTTPAAQTTPTPATPVTPEAPQIQV